MAPRDLHNWAEDLEAGRENDPALQLAGRLQDASAASMQKIQAPRALRDELRQRLLAAYDIAPDLAVRLQSSVLQGPKAPATLNIEMRQRLLATYDVDPELAERLRRIPREKVVAPQPLRLELRRRLLATYQKVTKETLGTSPIARPALFSRSLKVATSIAVLAMLLWLTGGFDASVSWAERMLNRIFITEQSLPPDVRATMDPVKVRNEEIRRQTAIARARTTKEGLQVELDNIQRKLPFTIMEPTYLPQGARLNALQEAGRKDEPGVQLEYSFRGGRTLRITQIQTMNPRTIAIPQDMAVREFQMLGHKAIIYDPGTPPGGKQSYFMEWTDGVIWVEFFTTLDPDELQKIAESMAP